MCRIILLYFYPRIFNDVKRSKTEFMLGPNSDDNFSSDTGLFVNRQYTNIHASHSNVSNSLSLTSEYGHWTVCHANILIGILQLPKVFSDHFPNGKIRLT